MLIQLTRGFVTEIDDADFDRELVTYWEDGTSFQTRVCDHKWHAHTPPHTVYARTGIIVGRKKFIQLHRLLTEAPANSIADHRDRNGLNNIRSNLRVVTAHESRLNTRKQTATNRYRGVYWNKKDKRWAARITAHGKTVWLGYFKDEVDAALAYDNAAKQIHGDFAMLNF